MLLRLHPGHFKRVFLGNLCVGAADNLFGFRGQIFGCLDLLVLTVLIAGVSKNVSCGIFSVMLYFLVPFVFSSGLQLFVFTIYRKDRREYLQMGAVILISILSLLTINIPGLYTFACLWIWGIALILGTGLLAAEIMLLYQMLCQGDELCILDD